MKQIIFFQLTKNVSIHFPFYSSRSWNGMFQRSLPSLSVFHTYGFKNFGLQVGHSCLSNFSSLWKHPHSSTNYSMFLGNRCLFRILRITECINAFIFIQCVIPKWQKIYSGIPHDFLPLKIIEKLSHFISKWSLRKFLITEINRTWSP